MPIVSPYQTCKLHGISERNKSISMMRGKLAVAPKDQISVGGPHPRPSIASGLRKIGAPISHFLVTKSVCMLSPQSSNFTSLKGVPPSP